MKVKTAKRTIIEIDQELCNGCGACETGCPEGALRVIDGKARLVGESLCDGLGACIGQCPEGALHFIEREAEDYDEIAVLKKILAQGPAVLEAHFAHLDSHGQDLFLNQAAAYLRAENIPLPKGFERFGLPKPAVPLFVKPCGAAFSLKKKPAADSAAVSAASAAAAAGAAEAPSAFPDKPSQASSLSNWPIQLHLVNPRAPFFENADLVVAADCTAFALGSFHKDIAAGKTLVIACPKLDTGRDIYVSKLALLFRRARSVSAVIMEVPCCSGLLKLLQEARALASAETAAGASDLAADETTALAGGKAPPMPIHTLVIGSDGSFAGEKIF